jgi:hypothetical protein
MTIQSRRSILLRIAQRILTQVRSNIPTAFMLVLGASVLLAAGAAHAGQTPRTVEATDRASQFMLALQHHDAEAMVTTLSPRYREQIDPQSTLNPGSEIARRAFERVAQRSTIVGFREISTVSLKQGGSVHLFVAESGADEQSAMEVPFTVTVSPDGYVEKVE